MALDRLLTTTSLTVIRPSSLPGWADCPRREAGKLFRDMIIGFGFTLRSLEPHVGAQIGTATHSAAFMINDHKIRTGEVGESKQAVEAGIEEFLELVSEGCIWDGATPNANDGRIQIARLVGSYATHLAPKLHPVRAEERLEMTVREGVIISGRKDLSCREPNALRDLKTGRPRSHATQLGTYAMLEEAHGHLVEHVFEDRLERTPIGRDQPPPDTVEYDLPTAKREAHYLIDDIGRSVDDFKARAENAHPHPEEAFRANPLSSLCSSRYCPCFGTPFCRVHRKETR